MDNLPDAFDAALDSRLQSEARDADKALRLFRAQPGFGRARLRLATRTDQLKQGDLPDFGTEARAKLALKLFDTRAKVLLPLVDTDSLGESYLVLLNFFKSVAWEEFTGYQRELLPAKGRFLAGVEEKLKKHEQKWLAKAREQSARHAQQVPSGVRANARGPEATRRRAMVDAYINEVQRLKGKRISRTDIWKKVGYKTRTEFERWERDDQRATKSAHDRFTKALTIDKPHLK